MVRRIRNIIMAGTFLTIAAGNATWDLLNSYLSFGLQY
ncbi:hypothetical protein GGD61_005119 [Bradyrhizobium sp. SBR1B]|nr:hypothetical protein [Bradyrhizobium sp. SBR1B]